MRITLFALLVVLVAACERESPYTACYGPDDNCREFRTREDMERWEAEDLVRRRNLARQLPVDYREVAFVVIYNFLHRDSPTETHRSRYFLSILEEDPDPALIARFAKAGVKVEPASMYASAETEDQADQQLDDTVLVSVGIREIRWIEADIYRADFGYVCGMLCAGGLQAFLQCREKECQLLRIEPSWLS